MNMNLITRTFKTGLSALNQYNPDFAGTRNGLKRFELKYLINFGDYRGLKSRLDSSMEFDKNSPDENGYRIRSLYFDSHNDDCLSDKLDGIQFRKKYRLRIYGVEDHNVKFEIKNKFNNQIYKETAVISRESAEEIIKGNYSEMLKYKNKVLNKAFIAFVQGAYKPRVTIDYNREAYIFNNFNVRITVDSDLRCSNTNYDMFSNNIVTIPCLYDNRKILEVKFDRVLPDFIKSMVQVDSFEKVAISKYAIARRIIKKNIWED